MNPKVKPLIRELAPTLYEDDWLLAVAKPAGVDAGDRPDQATTGLIDVLSQLCTHTGELHPINRLSRYESGVLLLGKQPATVEHIRKALRSGGIRQEYLAVVLGRMSRPQLDIHPARRASSRAAPDKDSRTSVVALHRGGNRTYVRCRTHVESTHALRAQLRGARLPVLGDDLYDKSRRSKSANRTCLHLAKMTFYHPGAGRKITVTSKPSPEFTGVVEGERDIERPLRAALARRLPCLIEPETDCCRLLTGDLEDVKGLVAEKYGQVVTLQLRGAYPVLMDFLPRIARWYQDTLGVQAVYARHFVKDRTHIDGDLKLTRMSPEPLVGKPVPAEIEILERGLKFVIRPHEAVSVGLFLDQRNNRSRVREMAAGKDLLNLFAYTCGFSVAAAAGGASSTVSVDISPKHLEWGKANFTLNGLALTNHQFIRSDADGYFKRARRQGKQFDLIIIDAPTFAHARRGKQSFSIARDLPALVSSGTEVLRPGGHMMISTNNRKLPVRRFKELIREGAGARHHRITSTPPLPIDFAVDRDHAKTIFVCFD